MAEVVSFHPCIEADLNLLCAGREPGPRELAAIRSAGAVILPQGCRQSLYEMARAHCRRVFPNYEARFSHPGKTGQIRLFRMTATAHPHTRLFADVGSCLAALEKGRLGRYPLVFKFDWGGEGEAVFRFDAAAPLRRFLAERTGDPPSPCLVQEFIPDAGRCLRVAVIGRRRLSYWRTAAEPDGFPASLAGGGAIDVDADPDQQAAGRDAVRLFCRKTGIDLAGIDLIFSRKEKDPLFLEVNYFFGRRGLGGSDRFYRMLEEEVGAWLGDSASPR